MPTKLGRAARVLPLFSAITIGSLLGSGVAFGRPQAVAAASGAKKELPATVTLQLKDTTILPATAPNAFRSGTQCDSDGDVFLQLAYFDFARGQLHSDAGISEIIPHEKRIVEYGRAQLPPGDYPNARLSRFSVTPNGAVSALIFTRRNPSDEEQRPRPEYYVERFKGEGTRGSITHIEAPAGAAHWFANLLAAFPNGNSLIVGTSSSSAGRPSAGSWQPFTGIYDSSGRFIRQVTLPEDVVNDFGDDAGGGAALRGTGAAARSLAQAPQTKRSKPRQFFEVAIATGGLASGPDGNVWILRASDPLRLYAVDAGGQVIHHFQLPPPVPGRKPSEFGFSGPGRAYFQFTPIAGDPAVSSGPSRLLAVFNTTSERIEGLYTLADAQKSARILACGDGRGGFLFVGGTSDNHLAVFDYGP
jgi:hypothetical protein